MGLATYKCSEYVTMTSKSFGLEQIACLYSQHVGLLVMSSKPEQC